MASNYECRDATTLMRVRMRERLYIALLVFVLALGIFVRVYRLGSWPPLYGDEAAPGVYALRGLAEGLGEARSHRVYLSAFHVLTQMPFVALLGNTVLALRLLSLVSGLLIIVAAYATGRRLWGPRAGLMAAAVAAIFPLSVVIGGRLAWEPTTAFPIVSWALYFSVLAWQQRSAVAAIMCGALLALGTYAHPAATMAVPGLVLGAVLSGAVKTHLRQLVVAAFVFALLSHPSVTLMKQLLSGDGVNMHVFTPQILATPDRPDATPWSLMDGGENLFRTLDQFTGAVTAQMLLGPLHAPWSRPIVLLRVGCVALWVIILVIAARSGSTGRFCVGYLAGLFVVAHLGNPSFSSLPQKGRYLLAATPVIPLLATHVGLVVDNRPGRVGKAAVAFMFAMWVGISGVMLNFMNRDVTGTVELMTTVVGEPNREATDFLLQNMDVENDLVICNWWAYWPIRYYARESLPMFSSDLVIAENERVSLPFAQFEGRVWWLQTPDAEPPPFPAELVELWPARNDVAHCYTIWLARDPEVAIKWAVEHYLKRLPENMNGSERNH
jgi:4-amino-4-deoxy-L-arabinose transferase-like glycosyltransferase